MTNTATQRPIYPFGDQPFALGMEDYQVDCATHADDLEQAIRGQWRRQRAGRAEKYRHATFE